MKSIALLIVAYHSQSDLIRLLSTIKYNRNFIVNVYVYHNDKIENYQLPEKPWLKIYQLGGTGNFGFAFANNRLIENVQKNDYYFILNPDIEFNPTSVYELCQSLIDITKPMLAYPILLRSYDEKSNEVIFDSAGIAKTWYGRFYDIASNDKFFVGGMAKFTHSDDVDIVGVCGACMIFNQAGSDLLSKLKFDECFFLYKEDIDLCIRLRDKGVIFINLIRCL